MDTRKYGKNAYLSAGSATVVCKEKVMAQYQVQGYAS